MLRKVKIKLSQIRGFFLLLALGIVFFAGGYQYALERGTGSRGLVKQFLTDPREGQVAGADFAKFWEVWKRLEQSYVDESALDYQEMTYGSIQGLAQSLGDPYTQYLPPSDNKRSREDLNGSFYGVGIELGYKDRILAVVAPLEGGPAKRLGVRAGDLILHIKDESKGLDIDTAGMSLSEAVEAIRGEKGREVVLTILHEGEESPVEIAIAREEIVVPSVELEQIVKGEKKIAHLKLHRFGGRTDSEWEEKIAEIVAGDVDGVILDLRNNPGGYLDGSVYIASEFLRSGVVVKQEGRSETETYSVDRVGRLLDVPLVVLVNGGSASASEITAGAIQDHGRGKLVGETTFGKGTVQEVQELSDGSSLHVTIAKWLLPGGRWIGDGGVKPDVGVADDPETAEVDEQVEAALGLF